MGGNASQLAARAIASIVQATYTHNDFLSSFAFFVDYLGIVVNFLDLKFAAPHDGLFSPVEGRRQVPLDGAKESLAFCVCVSEAGVHGIVVDGIIQTKAIITSEALVNDRNCPEHDTTHVHSTESTFRHHSEVAVARPCFQRLMAGRSTARALRRTA